MTKTIASEMTKQVELAPLIGATPEVVEKACKIRSELWPHIEAVTDLEMRPVSGRVVRLEVDPAQQRIKARLAKINNAHWWLKKTLEDIKWGVLNAAVFGMPRGAVLPLNWFDAEQVALRDRQAQDAARLAKFLDLPTLKGTAKQVPWANTIRDEFRVYCRDYGYSDETFMKVARSKDAGSARFWIDSRSELDFRCLADNAAA